jgi:hypothetical protein
MLNILVYRVKAYIVFHGATAPSGLLLIDASPSHSGTPHSVGMFWTGVQPEAETSIRQHTTLTKRDINASSGIRTHDPSKRAAADPRLRSRGYWERRKDT